MGKIEQTFYVYLLTENGGIENYTLISRVPRSSQAEIAQLIPTRT